MEMSGKKISSDNSQHVFRVDKFSVPETAQEEFLSRVRQTHEVLRKQPGFVSDHLLEQFAGSGEFNFVTIAEWQGQQYLEDAKSPVAAMHEELNFNPAEMFDRLNIKADLGNYTETRGQQEN